MSFVSKLNAVKFTVNFPNITKEYICTYRSHKFIQKEGKEYCFMDLFSIDNKGVEDIYYLPLWNMSLVRIHIDSIASSNEKFIVRTIRRFESKYPSYELFDLHERLLINSDDL